MDAHFNGRAKLAKLLKVCENEEGVFEFLLMKLKAMEGESESAAMAHTALVEKVKLKQIMQKKQQQQQQQPEQQTPQTQQTQTVLVMEPDKTEPAHAASLAANFRLYIVAAGEGTEALWTRLITTLQLPGSVDSAIDAKGAMVEEPALWMFVSQKREKHPIRERTHSTHVL